MPKDVPAHEPKPYAPDGAWPYSQTTNAAVFPYDGVSWGFYDYDWYDESGEARGRLQINVWSEGAGEEKSFSTWAKIDDPVAMMDRVQKAIRAAFEAGMRVERRRIVKELQEKSE